MKKIIVILSVILAIFLVSCDEADGFVTTDYSIDDTASALSIEFPESITYQSGSEQELNEDFLDYYFGNRELLVGVDSYVFITSPTTEVSEVGVFKVTDEASRNALLDAFALRQDNLIQIHTNYSADDLATSENLKTGYFDDVVYFIATNNNEKLEAIIKK